MNIPDDCVICVARLITETDHGAIRLVNIGLNFCIQGESLDLIKPLAKEYLKTLSESKGYEVVYCEYSAPISDFIPGMNDNPLTIVLGLKKKEPTETIDIVELRNRGER